jgi:hypothetical protein
MHAWKPKGFSLEISGPNVRPGTVANVLAFQNLIGIAQSRCGAPAEN